IPIAIVEGLLTVIFYNLISENASEREGLFL
ncbi:MAG: cobalamin biosynthesis protein CbiM, partial [Streptococcus parasanguinis]|nr:cobalamin biosynthesis protein CbiM [Streptococcus parasanguinis]